MAAGANSLSGMGGDKASVSCASAVGDSGPAAEGDGDGDVEMEDAHDRMDRAGVKQQLEGQLLLSAATRKTLPHAPSRRDADRDEVGWILLDPTCEAYYGGQKDASYLHSISIPRKQEQNCYPERWRILFARSRFKASHCCVDQ
jgi:hypothetical protein